LLTIRIFVFCAPHRTQAMYWCKSALTSYQ